MGTLFLGLSGPPGSGKSIFKDLACNDFSFREINLSRPIKGIAHRLIDREFCESEKDQPFSDLSGYAPRDLYAHIGALNKFVPDLWVRYALADQYLGSETHYVVDSVGNQAQWNALRRRAQSESHVSKLVEITRPGCGWIDNREPVSDCGLVIPLANNGSLATYVANSRRLLSELVDGKHLE